MSIELHKSFMMMALAESKKALPECLPNPPVGCVLVKDGVAVSLGHTRAPGSHHAEADALSGYSGSLSGVTAYVTLEPCSFHGRTPSCADALIAQGVKRVAVTLIDPDPRNNGKGLDKLRRAGVEVIEGVCAQTVDEFLGQYLN